MIWLKSMVNLVVLELANIMKSLSLFELSKLTCLNLYYATQIMFVAPQIPVGVNYFSICLPTSFSHVFNSHLINKSFVCIFVYTLNKEDKTRGQQQLILILRYFV